MHIGVVPEMFALIFKSAFTPKMDDELAFLLAEAHHNLGQLEGLIQYAPNRIPFCDLMVLKECTNSCYPSIIIFTQTSHPVLASKSALSPSKSRNFATSAGKSAKNSTMRA